MSSLQGKVALVTGGNSGIGLATVKAFHANGAKVVFSGRDRQSLDKIAQELGQNVLAVQADVTKLSDLDTLIARTHETFGNIDVLFVNAGIATSRAIEAETEDSFAQVLDTNLKGGYFTIQKALPILNEHASIIINGSINARMGIAHSSVYSASKAALHSLARTLSAEFADRGIRVNTLTIGPTETPILAGLTPESRASVVEGIVTRSPIKRLGRPEEVANAALFLASDDSSFVVGSEIATDGGLLFNTL
jgi:NAD(P)-dependent dehydrogenase (short-subunit alcohol dehydrogenase family)